MITVYSLWDIFMQLRTDCAPDYDLGCIVSEGIEALDPLLRDYFINEIRERVGVTFDATGILSARLYEIGGLLDTCDPEDYVCIANLEIPEIEAALKTTLVALINAITGMAADGTEFDERGISVLRLAQIHALIEPYTINDLEDLVSLIGAMPEIEEVIRQRWLEAKFLAIRDSLHADPTLNIDTLVNAYHSAITAAFGVSFEEDTSADDWQFIPLHFIYRGLEASTNGFASWVRSEVARQNKTLAVNRFSLFRRITGGLIFHNSGTSNTFPAQTAGRKITVWRHPNETRNWIMTPNNVIHEIGHSFTRSAGYGTVKIGSMEQSLDPGMNPTSPATNYTRDGMGPEFLRNHLVPGDYENLYYIHANIVNDDGTAKFVRLPNTPELPFDNYMLYDVFGDKYDLWNSTYNIYKPFGLQTRVDLFVQNYPSQISPSDEKLREITADSFLNWVRGSFEGTAGNNWNTFYQQNVGKFIRNSVVYRHPSGMGEYYVANGIIRETQTPSRNFLTGSSNPNVRLIPDENDSTINLGKAEALGLISSQIYGWWQSSTYIWLLINSTEAAHEATVRLAWVVSDGMNFDEQNDLVEDFPPLGNKIADYNTLNQNMTFNNQDICTILGMILSLCEE